MIAAIFISFASIFLPRNSGVRPTIRPLINTAMMIKKSIICYVVGSDQGNLLLGKKKVYIKIGKEFTEHMYVYELKITDLTAPYLIPQIQSAINDKLNWYSANELATANSLKSFLA